VDDEKAVSSSIGNKKTLLMFWAFVYSICYFVSGIFSSAIIGLPFLPLGQSIGLSNLFMPFPLRSCSFSLGGQEVCWWNLEYAIMSFAAYVLFLYIFLKIITKRKYTNSKKLGLVAVFVFLPIFLSVPVRYAAEFVKQKIYWEQEMSKFYEDKPNAEYVQSEVDKMRKNVKFEILVPEKMPFGLLLQKADHYGNDRVEMYYKLNMFSVTVIQAVDKKFGIKAVEQKNQEIQENYDELVRSLEAGRDPGANDTEIRQGLGKLETEYLLKSKAYIETTYDGSMHIVAYQEGDGEWRPYVYFQKSDVYFVIRLESTINVYPDTEFEEKEKLLTIAEAYLSS